VHIDNRIGELREGLRELVIIELESIGWFHRDSVDALHCTLLEPPPSGPTGNA